MVPKHPQNVISIFPPKYGVELEVLRIRNTGTLAYCSNTLCCHAFRVSLFLLASPSGPVGGSSVGIADSSWLELGNWKKLVDPWNEILPSASILRPLKWSASSDGGSLLDRSFEVSKDPGLVPLPDSLLAAEGIECGRDVAIRSSRSRSVPAWPNLLRKVSSSCNLLSKALT
jgi:hypothetical protein